MAGECMSEDERGSGSHQQAVARRLMMRTGIIADNPTSRIAVWPMIRH